MCPKTINIKSHNNLLVILLDVSISVLASLLSILVVRWQIHALPNFEDFVFIWLAASLVATLAGLLIFKTYRIVIRYTSLKSVNNIAAAVLVKEVILAVFLLTIGLPFASGGQEMFLLIADLVVSQLFMIMARVAVIVVHESIRGDIEFNVDRMPVMVYGTSDKSAALATRLIDSPNYHVVGFLSRDRAMASRIIQGYRVYNFDSEEDIKKFKVDLGVAGVLFSNTEDSDAEQDGLVRYCLHQSLHLLLTPRIEEIDYGGMTQSSASQITSSDFIPDGMSAVEREVKRIADLILSVILLVVFSPLILICAIAVKREDGGPVIFSQERIGRFGRPFKIYKFRTMRTDAEAAGPALYAGDDDPRLTKVGRFLRVHHLDELLQLWNVARGDMAFIGYRPERKFYIDQIMEKDPRYYYLYQIRPGVTSYSTLKNGYTDSMEKMLRRLEFDLYYLRHRSWWFDIKILFQTFMNIVFGKKF